MGTPNPPWQWWVGQYFSYDFSHGSGGYRHALVRCDAEQGSAAAHLGGLWEAFGRLWEAFGKLWGAFGRLWEAFGRHLGGMNGNTQQI